MPEKNLNRLRKLVGERDHLVYRAVMAGEISHLSGESLSIAEAIQDHLNLRHIHNALEKFRRKWIQKTSAAHPWAE